MHASGWGWLTYIHVCHLCHNHKTTQLALLPADFTVIVEKLKQLFGSNIMFGLEGGYDPEMVAAAVQATLAPFLPPVADRAAGAGEAPVGGRDV